MNAYQQAEQLKNLSDQQLLMTRGQVPEFLLVAELQRRQNMRKAYEASRTQARPAGSTVADELWSSVMPPVAPPMGGMAPQPQQGPASPSPVPAPPQQMMSMGGMVQRLAGGGMVRYAEGGAMARIQDLLASMQQPRSVGDYANDVRGMVGPDQMSPIMAEMAAQKAAPVVGKPSPWQALMRMGAGMMASRNPTPMGGLGEGLAMALNGYSQDRAAYQSDQIRQQEAQQRMLAQRAQLAAAMNDRNMGMARLGASIRGDDMSRTNTGLGLMGNAALSDSAADRAIQLEAMREAAIKPLRESQIAENQAQAEARAKQSRVFAAYLKKADGDEAKAENMMLRDRAAAQHFDRPPQIGFMEQMQRNIYAQAISDGASPTEAASAAATFKNRKDLTEERINERATRIWRTLLEADSVAARDPKQREALWQQALKMAAVGDFKQAKQEPVKPAKLGIKLGADGSIVMPSAKPQQQSVTVPFRVNVDQVMNPR